MDVAALDRALVMRTYARQPVEFVRGSGSWLWDVEGTAYLDLTAGLGVCALGHSHPAVVEAVRDQAVLAHVSNPYYTGPGTRLAERLSLGSLGGPVVLANSAAEANEWAIKLSRRRRPSGAVVSLRGGFHGGTAEALRRCVRGDTAAVVIELIQGEAGVRALPESVWRAAREACDESGALLVIDESQTGMGRTGEFWAWQERGVRPDLMTCATGFANGMPVGACVAAPELGDVFRVGDHGSTFVGGPVIAQAALAALDVVAERSFLDDVRTKGELLRQGIAELVSGEVRGLGLMLGFETDDAPGLVARALKRERLLLNATGPSSVRLLPSLTIEPEEIVEACARLERLL